MLEESLGADERVIQSMAQKMVGLLGQDLDIDFASPNDGMYGGLGVLTFSVHEIMGRTGELKRGWIITNDGPIHGDQKTI